jgi:hypothetical protein
MCSSSSRVRVPRRGSRGHEPERVRRYKTTKGVMERQETGCSKCYSSSQIDSGAVDSGAVDSGAVDSGAVDSGAVDSGAVDSGTVDSGAVQLLAPVLTVALTSPSPSDLLKSGDGDDGDDIRDSEQR